MDAGALAEAFAARGPLRAVNFHATPRRREAEYDRQLSELARRFAPCGEDDLAGFLRTGSWPGRRPGVIVALYNGYRDNWDVMRPLLDRHGLRGWFFVVTGWTGCPPEGQAAFARGHGIGLVEGEYPDGRHALSWDEVRALDRAGHVVASHTRSHSRVSESDPAALEAEIGGAQADFLRELGRPVRALAWLMGGAFGDNPLADAAALRAGHDLLVSNLRVQRLPALSPA